MLLYATVQSERATKGQGGKELMIEIMGENKEVVARIKVMPRLPYTTEKYNIEIYPVVYPDTLRIDVRGHGYELKRKGNKQKDEIYLTDCNDRKCGKCEYCTSHNIQ